MFLVVEPDILVARDLRESLNEAKPGAVIHHARGPEEAWDLLSRLDRITAAFLCLPREEIADGGIPPAVEGKGGHVVILDAPPANGDRREGWSYTGRPFGADAVAFVLRRLGGGSTGPG